MVCPIRLLRAAPKAPAPRQPIATRQGALDRLTELCVPCVSPLAGGTAAAACAARHAAALTALTAYRAANIQLRTGSQTLRCQADALARVLAALTKLTSISLSVRQLRHYFGAIAHAFLSAVPPRARTVVYDLP